MNNEPVNANLYATDWLSPAATTFGLNGVGHFHENNAAKCRERFCHPYAAFLLSQFEHRRHSNRCKNQSTANGV